MHVPLYAQVASDLLELLEVDPANATTREGVTAVAEEEVLTTLGARGRRSRRRGGVPIFGRLPRTMLGRSHCARIRHAILGGRQSSHIRRAIFGVRGVAAVAG
eukprot:6559413-Prymnesium_polylepis.1